MPTQTEVAIRTTNWKNMNFYRRTIRRETLTECLLRRREQDKLRIVQKILKRYPQFDKERAVVVSSRRFGKTTLYRLYTKFISLKELETALASRDRGQIAMAINKRINARGER